MMYDAKRLVVSGVPDDQTGILKKPLPGVLERHERKLTLKDVSFPDQSQRDIESSANEFHYCEGICIYPNRRKLSPSFYDVNQHVVYEFDAILPLTTNRIVKVTKGPSDASNRKRIVIETEEPHGLFVPFVPFGSGGEAKNVIHSYHSNFPEGTVPLSLIHSKEGTLELDHTTLEYIDEKSFAADQSNLDDVKGDKSDKSDKSDKGEKGEKGWLVTPPFPSLVVLANVLTYACNNVIHFTHYRDTARTEYMHTCHPLEFRGLKGDSLYADVFESDRIYKSWEIARVPPGNYRLEDIPESEARTKKGHRELSFSDALEAAMNRFCIEKGETNIIFRNSSGHTWMCSLPPGNYGKGEKLARCVEHMMNITADYGKKSTQISAPFTVKFVVENDRRGGRFVFSSPQPFDMLFGDDESMDPIVFGFDKTTLQGKRKYTSQLTLPIPTSKPNSNTYDVSVLPNSGNLRVARRPKPSLDGRIESYDNDDSLLKLRCVDRKTGLPVCHGLMDGNVVTLTTSLSQPDGATGEERESYVVTTKRKLQGVVVSAPHDDQDKNNAAMVYISVPNIPKGWNKGTSKYVNVDLPEFPFSILLFDKKTKGHELFPRCIGASRLGFKNQNGVTNANEGGVVKGEGTISLKETEVKILLFEESMSKSTNVFDENGQSMLGIVNKRGGKWKLKEEATTTLSSTSNSTVLEFKFVNMSDGTPHAFNGSPVTLYIRIENIDRPRL